MPVVPFLTRRYRAGKKFLNRDIAIYDDPLKKKRVVLARDLRVYKKQMQKDVAEAQLEAKNVMVEITKLKKDLQLKAKAGGLTRAQLLEEKEKLTQLHLKLQKIHKELNDAQTLANKMFDGVEIR